MNLKHKERVLTGDRVTGKLHLGHYVGSLQNRLKLQNQYETYILLADVQALTTHFERPDTIREHLREITLDYLAAGIEPNQAKMIVQSMIPEIAELTVFFSMFVTVNALRHNPTIKAESKHSSLDELNYGFLGYPVSQAADIAFCKATIVPVGDDQLPHLELARRVVRRFNELYRPVFPVPQPLISEMPRLVGTDGSTKMSKSLGNALELDSSPEQVQSKIRQAVTDPARIRRTDPGHPDICPIYAYHLAFERQHALEIHEACSRGVIGCTECKGRIITTLNLLLEPMRERRARYASKPREIDEILMNGTTEARCIARETLCEVREAMHLDYF